VTFLPFEETNFLLAKRAKMSKNFAKYHKKDEFERKVPKKSKHFCSRENNGNYDAVLFFLII
jgi:hypothetical protein